jgi:hypothetical protein
MRLSRKKQDVVIFFSSILALAAIFGLVYLFSHVVILPIIGCILIPIISIIVITKPTLLAKKYYKNYAYIVNVSCLFFALSLGISRMRYADYVGPQLIHNYKQIWYDDEDDETGRPIKSRGFHYTDENGHTKASIMMILWGVLTFGSPVLTYLQTKKQFDVLGAKQ